MEKRLTDFAITILFLIKDLKNCYEARYLGQQIIRSGTSTALNFGEAKSSESKKDFIHKSSVVLKELRETYVNLNILEKARLHEHPEKLQVIKNECNKLISILVKSINTAKRNL